MAYADERKKNFSKYLALARRKKTFILQKILKRIAAPTLFLLGVRVFDREKLPEETYILAPSHSNFWDPVLVSFASREDPVRFVGKSQVFRFPLVHIVLALGAFPVRRRSADRESLETALSLIEKNHHLVIFPQGTRLPDIKPEQAKWGSGFIVNKSSVPVVPVYIDKRERGWGLKRDVYFGESIKFPQIKSPSQEDNIRSARILIEAIIDLSKKKHGRRRNPPRSLKIGN